MQGPTGPTVWGAAQILQGPGWLDASMPVQDRWGPSRWHYWPSLSVSSRIKTGGMQSALYCTCMLQRVAAIGVLIHYFTCIRACPLDAQAAPGRRLNTGTAAQRASLVSRPVGATPWRLAGLPDC